MKASESVSIYEASKPNGSVNDGHRKEIMVSYLETCVKRDIAQALNQSKQAVIPRCTNTSRIRLTRRRSELLVGIF